MDANYSLNPQAIPKGRNTRAILFSLIALYSCYYSAGALNVNEYPTHTETINILFEDSSTVATNIEESYREYMLTRLSHFLNDLSMENWDGYGAYPIERQSYANAVMVVNNTPEDVLKLWNVFPSPNGTISLEFKAREVAAMSIGNSDFSYIARSKKTRKAVKNKLNFDLQAATDALVTMSKHLGYL